MEHWVREKYQPNLPLGEERTYVTACPEHLELSRRAAGEGMVLLKNEGGLLPLTAGTRVALFGKASFDYVQGGGGSGEVHSAYRRNLYEGLKMKGNSVRIFEPLSDFYRANVSDQYQNGALPGLTREPSLPEGLAAQAAWWADVAIVSICRFSGEGWDRKTADCPADETDTEEYARLSAAVFEHGDFCLTDSEKAMIEEVKSNFDRIVVVLNIGGIMETGWFRNEPKIQSALLAWSAGQEGGLAMADILTGEVNPSGRLVDTLAEHLEDYPFSSEFHKSRDYVEYTEDIYVGYRYFETIPGAKEKVCYPFGYGLSYTTFSRECLNLTSSADGNDLICRVRVTNTGTVPGKEVVQLYVEAPQGLLGKPARQLVSFSKTGLLAPGGSEELDLTFPMTCLASYDDLGKIQKSAWVLEKGLYHFYLGGDVRSAERISPFLNMTENEVSIQLSEHLKPSHLPRRLLADGTFEELETSDNGLNSDSRTDSGDCSDSVDCSCSGDRPDQDLFLPVIDEKDVDGLPPAYRAMPGWHPFHEVKSGLHSLDEVAEVKFSLDEFMDQMTVDEMLDMLGGQPNTGVANTFGIGDLPRLGVPNIMTCDGPAGVRIFPQTGIRTTCFPCATLLACTWNPELTREIGAAGALEVKENNMAVWLTPAVNIHRSPLCGRNFEYYSEDPLISGIMAAEMVKGIQSQKVSACVKHFAFNNKETNRKHSDSRVSERAAREIYLRAFRIIVTSAHPWAVMTSYNKVNGIHTSQNHELIEDILRGEWGFDGMVTTDWWVNTEHWPEVLAGNDLKMAIGYPDRVRAAMDRGLVTESDLRKCVRNILTLILRVE